MSVLSEQIATLKEVGADPEGLCYPQEYLQELINQATDTIETLSAKLQAANMERSTSCYNGGWIECEEKLPPQPDENPSFDNKPLELYLVYVKGGDYPFRAFWNGKYFTDGWNKVNAFAWMPLPELPEPYKQQ